MPANKTNVDEIKKSNTSELLWSSIVDPPKPATIISKAGRVVSNNYWQTEYMTVFTNVKRTRDGPTVQLPNNETMSTTRTENITLESSLSAHAKKTHIFDGLYSASYISLSQMFDDDCVAILYKNIINILKGKTLILKGHRNKTDGLWDIPISRPVRHCAMEIITKDKTKTELIQYLHGCCFRTTPRTFLKAINNGKFLTWPGLNNQQLFKHITPSITTSLGHMGQERKTSNLQRI